VPNSCWHRLEQPVQLGSLSWQRMKHGSDQRCIILRTQYRSCIASVFCQRHSVVAGVCTGACFTMHPLGGSVLTQLHIPCPLLFLPCRPAAWCPVLPLSGTAPTAPSGWVSLRAVSGQSVPCVRRSHAQQRPVHAHVARCQTFRNSTRNFSMHFAMAPTGSHAPACSWATPHPC
jgi:hypothetical protein